MQPRQQIIELNERLSKASEAYYKKNQPIMSDAEFDRLERELKELIVKHPEFAVDAAILRTVGNDLTGGRIPHSRPMLSIENKYELDEVREWYSILPSGTDAVVEPKFDGVSVSILYLDHKLSRALTRGDGKSGEDITQQVLAVKSIPQVLKSSLPHVLEVRGELVMRNSTLERINKEAAVKGGKVYTSTRNLTGGTMKLKDVKLIPDREIQFRPWEVAGDDSLLPDSGLKRLIDLATSGFEPPLGRKSNTPEKLMFDLKTALEDRDRVLRQVHSLETDGVVIKADSHKLRKQLGVSSKYTNWQICFKPQSASGTTYLRSIEWQVGRTGKVSPVAVCDPVILAGAKVEHANLNNITWIREKGLKLGAKVAMLRSGDVIPQIVRVLDEGESEIIPPSNCPECRTLLEESDEGGAGTLTHRCPNKGCPGRVQDTLTFIGSREVLEIDGLGPEMAAKLASESYARTIAELFEFQAEALGDIADSGEERFVEQMRKRGFDVTIVKMVKSLEKAKTAPWERWIKALCIPMIGATLGRAIAIELDLQPDDFQSLVSKLVSFTRKQVEGFGEAKMQAIRDWCVEENNKFCYTLYENGVRPMPTEKPKTSAPLGGIVFCITGTFVEDRDSITKKLESLGATAKSGVSKKINLLLVGADSGSKLDKAKALGIRIEGSDWLAKTFAENGIGLGE